MVPITPFLDPLTAITRSSETNEGASGSDVLRLTSGGGAGFLHSFLLRGNDRLSLRTLTAFLTSSMLTFFGGSGGPVAILTFFGGGGGLADGGGGGSGLPTIKDWMQVHGVRRRS